jgi:predicted nucleic acid-binding protein
MEANPDRPANAGLGGHRPQIPREPLTLVLDSNVVVAACTADEGFSSFGDETLIAPPLMWSEFYSSVHEARWRGELSDSEAADVVSALERGPVRPRAHRRLRREAWRLADGFGWAKTYDVEYVALASLLGCRLVTLDGRLRRGADRLGFVVSPTEL